MPKLVCVGHTNQAALWRSAGVEKPREISWKPAPLGEPQSHPVVVEPGVQTCRVCSKHTKPDTAREWQSRSEPSPYPRDAKHPNIESRDKCAEYQAIVASHSEN